MPDAPTRESERLQALDRYDVLDTPPEEAFDRVTRLARRVFDVPVSTVSLIDAHRQWFKSRQGMPLAETPRGPALCDVAVRAGQPLVIPDTLADARVSANPFVVGPPHIRFYAGVPLRTHDGHVIGTLCVVDTKPRSFGADEVDLLSDLARIVMTEMELRLVAATDSLTGALSRRAFREEAGRALALAQRHRHDLSCLALDLDHFKTVNDGWGHAMGDRVLAETVATCRSLLRASDPIGRLGGEEFAILLPLTGGHQALQVAEKLRAAVARQRVEGPAGPVAVTASFGVATADRSVGDVDDLLQRADTALYAAKADGRNRCTRWNPIEEMKPEVRRRVLKAGRITFNAGRSTIDCTVRALSDAGAALDVISAAGIPDDFKLQIESDDLYRRCRITGKAERRLEVAFA